MSDRALQDHVIRALADAPYRASTEWHRRALADPERVERYARFLARHFYYERIVHFFKYSRALARATGRRPEAVLNQPGFDALLPTVVLGSRASTQAVAAVLELADGRRTLGELAAGAGLEVAELEETLQGLVDLGAVRFSTGS